MEPNEEANKKKYRISRPCLSEEVRRPDQNEGVNRLLWMLTDDGIFGQRSERMLL